MRSDAVKTGTQQAPHRSLFNALGMTKEEMDRPLVGIVRSYNEIVPGHMNLDKITQAVKLGVAMAGGTPVMFPAIAVCDGIAMGHVGMKYSLVTREYFIPMCPIAIPSQTAIAGNTIGVPPAIATPCFTAATILSRFIWPGTISL